MSDGGKGDSPRPLSVPQKKFAHNWDIIFTNQNKSDSEETGEFNTDKPNDSLQGG